MICKCLSYKQIKLVKEYNIQKCKMLIRNNHEHTHQHTNKTFAKLKKEKNSAEEVHVYLIINSGYQRQGQKYKTNVPTYFGVRSCYFST